ncbi:MAG TPA: hypothetical protein VG796_00300 [Verrucomicrobiales bacterium]|jgi:hypothetical protein|nr:hypothetical protein [Verrucomicrobiales bacterium]
MAMVQRTMDEGVSSRHGSKLSGQKLGNSELDLNRQMAQTNDPQGMYIIGADGTPYAFANDHDPADIHELMNLGLQRFRERPPARVAISDTEKNAPFSVCPPETAQVFQVFARIPSPPKDCSLLNNGVGRDFCWIYKNERCEVAQLASRGKAFDMPVAIARRIARFHLMDGVRGTPDMWQSDEVKSLRLRARPTGPGQLILTGKFSLRARSGRRGYTGTIEGTLTFDPDTFEWTRLRLLADGTAFGAGTYTPNQPPRPYRLLVGLLNTTLPEARFVPPEEVATRNGDKRYQRP